MPQYLYIWPNGAAEPGGWVEIDETNPAAVQSIAKDGAKTPCDLTRFYATDEMLEWHEYIVVKGKLVRLEHPVVPVYEELMPDGLWSKSTASNILEGLRPSSLTLLQSSPTATKIKNIILLNIELQDSVRKALTKDIQTLDELARLVNLYGDSAESFGMTEVVLPIVARLVKNEADLESVLAEITTQELQQAVRSIFSRTNLANPDNIHSLDDFVESFSQLAEKDQEELFHKIKQKILKFLSASENYLDDFIKVISVLPNLPVFLDVIIKDESVYQKFDYHLWTADEELLEKLPNDQIIKILPYLPRDNFPSDYVIQLSKLSDEKFKFILDNFDYLFYWKLNDRGEKVDARLKQHYRISELNLMFWCVRNDPVKQRILIDSLSFKEYLKRYNARRPDLASKLALFTAKRLPDECISFVELKSAIKNLKINELNFELIENAVKFLNDEDCRAFLAKVNEYNYVFQPREFSKIIGSNPTRAALIEECLPVQYAAWCNSNVGSSRVPAIECVTYERALSYYETAKLFMTRRTFPTYFPITSDQRMALVENHAEAIYEEMDLSKAFEQIPATLEKFSANVKNIFGVDLTTTESYAKFKDSSHRVLKDCVTLFHLREHLSKARDITTETSTMIEFELLSWDTKGKARISLPKFLGLEETEKNPAAIKKGFTRLSLKYHPDRVKNLPSEQKTICAELFILANSAQSMLSNPSEKYRYQSAKTGALSYLQSKSQPTPGPRR